MSKVTFVVDFPDGQEPPVHANMNILGGKLSGVSWRDLLTENDKFLELLAYICDSIKNHGSYAPLDVSAIEKMIARGES
ncbi:hypothetical protein [Pectobacterium brasiliense]|uniref:hypothetical protein n=1 Tax=Pectobacterium brasiliense TaxID=180957 RepID=UPI003987CA32